MKSIPKSNKLKNILISKKYFSILFLMLFFLFQVGSVFSENQTIKEYSFQSLSDNTLYLKEKPLIKDTLNKEAFMFSDSLKEIYYNQKINLYPKNLSKETNYFKISLSSYDRNFFSEIFTVDEKEEIFFQFSKDYPHFLNIKYQFFSEDKTLINQVESSLFLKEPEIDVFFFFCKDLLCKEELLNPSQENKFYLSSNNPDLIYNVTLSSRNFDYSFKEVSFPLSLSLKEGVYNLSIGYNHLEKNYLKDLKFYVFLQESDFPEKSLISFSTPNLLDDNLDVFNKQKKPLSKNLFILIAILLLIGVYFMFRQSPSNRRLFRKKNFLIFLFILLISTSINAQGFSDDLSFNYLTENIDYLKDIFPKEPEINIYVSDVSQVNSYFLPLFSYPYTSYSPVIVDNLEEGNFDLVLRKVLFSIDTNKELFPLAPFLPSTGYSSSCEYILDYFKDFPIKTKADLLNREKDYLINELGFSSECIDDLISKKWLLEKDALLEIKFSPKDFENLSKINHSRVVFPRTVISNELVIALNIIKHDPAILYIYPNPINYNDLKLFSKEKAWVLEGQNINLKDINVSEVFSLSFSSGTFGDSRVTLENLSKDHVSFKINYLNSTKSIFFDSVNRFNFIDYADLNISKNVLSNYFLTYDKDLILNNYEIYNISENRPSRIRPSFNQTDSKRLISRKNYSLFESSNAINDFYLLLDQGYKIYPIFSDDQYIFYNVDNNIPGYLDLYYINLVNNNYFFYQATASYFKKTYDFSLENQLLKIDSISTNNQNTSVIIYFKEYDQKIILSSDNKNILSTKDPYIYVFNDYLITFVSGFLKVYKFDESLNHSFPRINLDEYYFSKLNSLTGNYFSTDVVDSNFLKSNNLNVFLEDTNLLRRYNQYVFDISTAVNFSNQEKKMFWSNGLGNLDFTKEFWFYDSNLCNPLDLNHTFNSVQDFFAKTNFTILKYPGYFISPFSEVKEDTADFVISREQFSLENYKLLCSYLENSLLDNYTGIIFSSAMFKKESDDFINSLTYFNLPINNIYPDLNKSIIYNKNYLSAFNEGIVFFDKNKSITFSKPLSFSEDYFRALDVLNNYLIIDRILDENVSFNFEKEINSTLKNFVMDNYVSDYKVLSLKFKLPKRKHYLNDGYISDKYLVNQSRFFGNCSYLSMHVASTYYYNNIRFKVPDNNWWLSDFGSEDAWFLRNKNQVIWNYKLDSALNYDSLFEGLLLGTYIGRTEYTYGSGFRADQTFKNLLYTHVVPFIGRYKNTENNIINAGTSTVSLFDVNSYFSDPVRSVREILVPKYFYDNKIKDEFGKTELDYVKEHLTRR